MQPGHGTPGLLSQQLFQSSSSQKAGCNVAPATPQTLTFQLFQSSSSQKAGCNVKGGCYVVLAAAVSILIQPEGRMQQARKRTLDSIPTCFNPHPARRPDATMT